MYARFDRQRFLFQLLGILVVVAVIRFARNAAQRPHHGSLGVKNFDLQLAFRLLLEEVVNQRAARRIRKASRSTSVRPFANPPADGVGDGEEMNIGPDRSAQIANRRQVVQDP